MPIYAQLASGRTLEFPDGTAREVIERTVKQQTLIEQARADEEAFRKTAVPTSGMSGTQKFLAGAGQGMTNLARGIGQITGLVDQQAIDEAAQRDKPLLESGAGAAGSIGGTVATTLPAMLVPGANTLAGSVITGGAIGALDPVESGESRTGNMVAGAAGGGLGFGAGKVASRLLNPQTSQAAVDLLEQGITPTPGQILGGGAKKVESAAESIPFVGQGIRNARSRAAEQFNQAAINRALEPIGASVKEIGHEGIKQARSAVEQAYDDALALLPRVDFDAQFDNALRNVRQMATTLTAEHQGQLERIIQSRLLDKLTPAKTLSGESFKAVESDLKREAREFLKSADYDQRQMGSALNAIVGELRGLASRASPEAAEALQKADTAYARLLRVERAASMQGAPTGVFSPAQLGNAIRGMDGSLRKGAVARGDALMQDLSTAGREVLGDTLPNSGTADRLLNTMMLGGGYMIDPVLAGLAVGARGAYTDPVQGALASILTRRPEALRAAGNYVEQAAPIAGLAGVGAFLDE